jgi:hypothetical protein
LTKAEYEAALGFEVMNKDKDSVVSKSEFLQAYRFDVDGVVAQIVPENVHDHYRSVTATTYRNTLNSVQAEALPPASTTLVTNLEVPITMRQYGILALKASLPFVGFGFVDNFVMIIAGDRIELSLGTALFLNMSQGLSEPEPAWY